MPFALETPRLPHRSWSRATLRRWLVVVVALGVAAASRMAAAQEDDDNELDRFMERVLQQRERNAAARLQYVLDEQSQLRITGPGGVALWGFRGDYTWYERDGFFVRSPIRIDGVTIDEPRRREYEARWLEREQRRRERRREERRSPARVSRRSTRANVELAIERLWEARVDDEFAPALEVVIGAVAPSIPAFAIVSARVRREEHTPRSQASEEIAEHAR